MDDLRYLEQLGITSWKVAKTRSNRQACLCSSSFSLDCGSYILSDKQDKAQVTRILDRSKTSISDYKIFRTLLPS